MKNQQLLKVTLLLIFIMTLIGCNTAIDPDKVTQERIGKEASIEIIDWTLEALVDSFDNKHDNEFAMNQKYNGKRFRITGRTSGVSEDGVLRLQLKPFDESIKCYDIDNTELLMNIRGNEIVSIEGTLVRKGLTSYKISVLENCSGLKILKQSK